MTRALVIETASLAQTLANHLLVANSELASLQQRAEAWTAAFAVWPKVCRRMAELEQLQPLAAENGRERDARLQNLLGNASLTESGR